MIYAVSRFIFEVIIRFLLKLRITGKENIPKAPFIIASNHASNLDPPLVGIACKKYHVDFFAKKELFDRPFLGAWMRAVGAIEVERSKGIKGIRDTLSRLKQGGVVSIFPEGTRSQTGDLQGPKQGVGFLISKAGVPVVPMLIDGSGKAWPKGGKIKPGYEINITIGRPVGPEELGIKDETRDYSRISETIMDRIKQLQNKKKKVKI